VFAGGWSLEAAEAVCGEGVGCRVSGIGKQDRATPYTLFPTTSHEVLDLLTSLLDQSLVEYQAGEGEPRYRMLETIRAYAWERLPENGEEEEARRRHLAYFLALAEEAEPHLYGTRELEWLERLERDHDNLRAALSCAEGCRGKGVGCSESEGASPTPYTL